MKRERVLTPSIEWSYIYLELTWVCAPPIVCVRGRKIANRVTRDQVIPPSNNMVILPTTAFSGWINHQTLLSLEGMEIGKDKLGTGFYSVYVRTIGSGGDVLLRKIELILHDETILIEQLPLQQSQHPNGPILCGVSIFTTTLQIHCKQASASIRRLLQWDRLPLIFGSVPEDLTVNRTP